jgi:hypothetical protein
MWQRDQLHSSRTPECGAVTIDAVLTTCRSTSFAATAAMKAAPVGDWETPITSELITSQSVGLSSPHLAEDGYLYWTEGRPTEGGRVVLVRGCAHPYLPCV